MIPALDSARNSAAKPGSGRPVGPVLAAHAALGTSDYGVSTLVGLRVGVDDAFGAAEI